MPIDENKRKLDKNELEKVSGGGHCSCDSFGAGAYCGCSCQSSGTGSKNGETTCECMNGGMGYLAGSGFNQTACGLHSPGGMY